MPHQFKIKTFQVRGAEDCAASQGSAFTLEKVNVAVTQALSLWTAVAPISFVPVAPGAASDIDIHFVNNGHTAVLGNAIIEINVGNSLFIDLYNETVFHPSYVGPYDLVAEIAHEVGHDLGLNHPPTIPGTDVEEYPDALMSQSFTPGYIERSLKPYDILSVQTL